MIDRLIELLSKIPFESRAVQTLVRFLRRRQAANDDPFIEHYGCPSSKRTEKLQLQKRKIQKWKGEIEA